MKFYVKKYIVKFDFIKYKQLDTWVKDHIIFDRIYCLEFPLTWYLNSIHNNLTIDKISKVVLVLTPDTEYCEKYNMLLDAERVTNYLSNQCVNKDRSFTYHIDKLTMNTLDIDTVMYDSIEFVDIYKTLDINTIRKACIGSYFIQPDINNIEFCDSCGLVMKDCPYIEDNSNRYCVFCCYEASNSIKNKIGLLNKNLAEKIKSARLTHKLIN
jgi:hypothetical protein